MENDSSTLMTLIIAAGTGLAGAVSVLFKIVMKQSDEQQALSKEVGKLQGKQDGIRQLSADVLQTVHEACSENEKTD